ncbi:unnamed protein product [Clonostachys rosea]|uniref:Major facilitator superfamily (MFS) profile domain-containing protein n=1 Tax=Bionectria ochroleuca TaxID=29856 RepID=A0ABY6UK96_BIOOC|nr:unnamed protein product [Clonostachys rosea]
MSRPVTTIGYDSGYLNGVLGSKEFVHRYGEMDIESGDRYLTPWTRSVFTSLLIVGTILGCILSAVLSDRIGRRGSLFLAAVSYTIGVALQTSGLPATAFIIGRVLLGNAIGIISNVVPIYLMDCSSETNRGRLMAMYLQFLTSGNVLACGISLGTSQYTDSRGWRVTIGFQLLFGILIGIGACSCPESPAVLVKWGKLDLAKKSFSILKNQPIEGSEVQAAVTDLQISLDEEQANGDVSFLECFKGTNLRRTLLGLAMAFFTIATGITFWFGYGTTFFMATDVTNPYLISLVLAITNCVFTAPSIYLIEKLGRRDCLLWGGAIMALTQLLTGIIHSASPSSTASRNMLVAGAVIFIAAYAPTWGVGGWVIMTEPYSNRLRVYQTAIVMACYWTIQWLVGFVTPYMVDATAGNLGVNVAYIWFGTGVVSVIWAYFYVPELAGLSILDVDTLFEEGVPARRSKAWGRQRIVIESTEHDVKDDSGMNTKM